jgi:hypothetical protein
MFNGNLTYEIKELKENSTDVDLSEVIDEMERNASPEEGSTSNSDMVMDNYVALELYYQENFTLKDLNKICDYYEISRRKLRKDEIVQEIVLFECDPNNSEIVQKRKLLWFYVSELKNDKYFKKFVIFD